MSIDELPDDPVVLKSLLLKQYAEREQQLVELGRRDSQLAELMRDAQRARPER
jgi:hypothetical protein